MPDFNNGPGNDLNSSRSLAPRRLLETDVNNDPPQANPNPVSDGEYICSGLLRLFESSSNSGPILALSVYLNLTRLMALPWAIPESERKVAQKRT